MPSRCSVSVLNRIAASVCDFLFDLTPRKWDYFLCDGQPSWLFMKFYQLLVKQILNCCLVVESYNKNWLRNISLEDRKMFCIKNIDYSITVVRMKIKWGLMSTSDEVLEIFDIFDIPQHV